MHTHAVNRQVFDFTCSSESVAEAIRHEFLHFTSVELNRLLNDVLTAHDSKKDNLLIDRIEIDLGELKPENFGNSEMLSTFTTLLAEEIVTSQKEMSASLSSGATLVKSRNQEILESLFLHGDLPWWLDKAVETNQDRLIQSIFEREPEAVRTFFERNRENQAMLMRLHSPRNGAGRAIFTELFGIRLSRQAGVFSGPQESEISSYFQDWLSKLPASEVIEAINLKLSNDKNEKQLLINKLVKSKQLKKLADLTGVDLFPTALPSEILTTTGAEILLSPAAKQALAKILLPLSVVQLRFINWWISNEVLPVATDKKNEHAFVAEEHDDLLTDTRVQNPVSSALSPDNPEATSIAFRGSAPDIHILLKETARTNEKTETFAELKPKEQTHVEAGDLPLQKTDAAAGTSVENQSAWKALSASDKSFAETNNLSAKSEHSDSTVLGRNLNSRSPEHLHVFNKSASQRNTAVEWKTPLAAKITTLDAAHLPNPTRIEPGEKSSDTLQPDGINWSQNPQLNQLNATDRIKPRSAEFAGVLMKELENTNQHLLYYLLQLPEITQKQISKVVSGNPEKKSRKRKIINGLSRRSETLELQLALLLATHKLQSPNKLNNVQGMGNEQLDAGQELNESGGNNHQKSGEVRELDEVSENKIEQSAKTLELMLFNAQSDVKMVLDNLSRKELFVLQNIYKKSEISTTNEQALIRKFLLQLEADTLCLLDALAAKADNRFVQQALASENTFAPRQPNELNHVPAEENDNQHKIYIANGGLCLLAPYLNGLFTNLGYLENSVFKNKAIQTRAFYLMQYIATGKSAAPEFVLQLNKLLCGAEPQEAIGISIRLTKKEKSEAEELIESVIANWKALKNTSVQGFRESFLQRKGIITENELSWTLQVERLGHDLLLDTIPWGFKLIKLTWMKKMLQVEW